MAASKEVIINGVSSQTIPELVIGQVWRSLLGSFRGVQTYIPGRPGTWHTAARRGTRVLRMSCFVQVQQWPDDRRDAITAVADWVDWDQEVKIELSDMPGKYYMGTLGDVGEPEEWRDAGVFDLEFIIQPYAYDNSLTSETWTSGVDTNHSFSPGLIAPVYPTIYITPTNGDLTGFTLESNGDTIEMDGLTIASGTSMVIDSNVPIVASVVAVDVEVSGGYQIGSILVSAIVAATGFPVLMPGVVNNVYFHKIGGTATSFTITVDYRKTYRS